MRTLSIWINGPDARDYLTLIRDDIHTILARLDIDFKELLALPGTARIGAPVRRASGAEHAPYQQILAYDNQGVAEYISPSGTRYNVRKVLLGYVSEENLEKERKQFIVNINNSRLGDVTVADLIDSSFNQEQPRQKTSGKSPPPVVDPGFWVDLARVFKKYRPFHKKTVSINFTNLAYLLISAPKLPRPCIGPSPV